MPFDSRSQQAFETLDETISKETDPPLFPIYAVLAVFTSLMVASVAFFGLPGLYIPAVALVPLMFILLIRITVG